MRRSLACTGDEELNGGESNRDDWERLTREIVRDTRASFILERYFRGSMPALRADIQSCYD
jgi:hypothetical protein